MENQVNIIEPILLTRISENMAGKQKSSEMMPILKFIAKSKNLSLNKGSELSWCVRYLYRAVKEN